jgi:hypothetical protein
LLLPGTPLALPLLLLRKCASSHPASATNTVFSLTTASRSLASSFFTALQAANSKQQTCLTKRLTD